MTLSRLLTVLILLGLQLGATTPPLAMGTTLTYQGSLEDGSVPAHGSYDSQFFLIDSSGNSLGGNTSTTSRSCGAYSR